MNQLEQLKALQNNVAACRARISAITREIIAMNDTLDDEDADVEAVNKRTAELALEKNALRAKVPVLMRGISALQGRINAVERSIRRGGKTVQAAIDEAIKTLESGEAKKQ